MRPVFFWFSVRADGGVKAEKGKNMKAWILEILFLTGVLFAGSFVLAHGEKEDKKAPGIHSETVIEEPCEQSRENDQFPGFHPLVVHFPIVLLLLAPIAHLGGMLARNRAMRFFAFLMASGGLLGALAAARVFHPHTGPLPDSTMRILKQHELYADLTLLFSFLATVAATIALSNFGQRFRANIPAFLLMVCPAVFVSLAGHHGAELVHIHGVGPCGKYLEIDGHSHDEP
ncbi:MAG: hypothetical protein KDK30_04095 [Leptospiraceae bacterium]|nr:hypothetical protein [Leptospiraceae bacterium]